MISKITGKSPTPSNLLTLCLAIVVICTWPGCSTPGQSQSYLLQYKKELRVFYAFEDKPHPQEAEQEQARMVQVQEGKLRAERQAFLPVLYASNLPFFLTDLYDLRSAKKPIRAGDNLNVIINRVHLQTNPAAIGGSHIAVIVTVDDGKKTEPRNVLVAYSEGIQDNTQLPISDLLAYSTDSYDNEPVRIDVTILHIDDFLFSKIPSELLSTGAQIGKSASPAAAPLISLATQIGNYLIKKYQQQVLATFSFQLYPWKLGHREPISGHVGVPKVFAQGHYIIVRTDNGENIDPLRVHVDWDLKPYQLDQTTAEIMKFDVEKNNALKPWPIPSSDDAQKTKSPLAYTYLVLTIDDGSLSRANMIIDHMDTINRATAELAKAEVLTENDATAIKSKLDDLKSLTALISIESRFTRVKELPTSLQVLLDNIDEEKDLNLKDRLSLFKFALSQVDFEQCGAKLNDRLIPLDKGVKDSGFYNWFTTTLSMLAYNQETGQYQCLLTNPASNSGLKTDKAL